jgi:FkbM family methyltransferase
MLQRLRRAVRAGRDAALGLASGLRGHRVVVEGCHFDLSDPQIGLEIRGRFVRGAYERDELRLLEVVLDPSRPVVELGGCLGVVSAVTNRRLADRTQHVVLEANPALLPILERHRAMNGAGFAIRHGALAYGSETVELFLHRTLVTASSAQMRQGRAVRVPATTLTALLDEAGFASVTLIADVEGAERELIEHEPEVLSRVDAALIELHPQVYGEDGAARILAAFRQAGLREAAASRGVHALVRA